MEFASEWLEKNALFPAFISEAPDRNTGLIIVVPAYNEPDVRPLLDSLRACDTPGCQVEILIVVNAPETVSNEALLNNRVCIQNIERWKKHNEGRFFRLFVFDTGNHGIKKWGVGHARKTGMDEALRRFSMIGNPDGAIVSLDADCTVRSNYLSEIYLRLVKSREMKACSIYFEHPLSESEFPEPVLRSILQYELHLRYYLQAVKYSGFPYCFHTVGSAMACKASTYLKAGGMNTKQAAEDFYFIQKLVSSGGYFSLNTTAVYPSPRESFRVPLGTGVTINRMIANNTEVLLTYNLEAFSNLRPLFSMAEDLYQQTGNRLIRFHNELPAGLRSFIKESEWENRITEIQQNTASKESFLKRFYSWFNMFRIVKYLNYVHAGFYEKQPVAEAASLLLSVSGNYIRSNDVKELLLFFRSMELYLKAHTRDDR